MEIRRDLRLNKNVLLILERVRKDRLEMFQEKMKVHGHLLELIRKCSNGLRMLCNGR